MFLAWEGGGNRGIMEEEHGMTHHVSAKNANELIII